MTTTASDSFVLNDLQNTQTVSSESGDPEISEAWVLYKILVMAQRLCIDFLPVTHQQTLGSIGRGATGVVRQGYINSRLELAFKTAETLSKFLNEMITLSLFSLRTHCFTVTIEGLGWTIQDETGDIRPALVFEKAAHGSLESFMRGNVGRSLNMAQRIALCCQIAIVMRDMEEWRSWPISSPKCYLWTVEWGTK